MLISRLVFVASLTQHLLHLAGFFLFWYTTVSLWSSEESLPPTPRLTFWGNWSLLKSWVSLKTATGVAWGTSENTDMAARMRDRRTLRCRRRRDELWGRRRSFVLWFDSVKGRWELAGAPMGMKLDPPQVKVRPQRGSTRRAASWRHRGGRGRGMVELRCSKRPQGGAKPTFNAATSGNKRGGLKTSPIWYKDTHFCVEVIQSGFMQEYMYSIVHAQRKLKEFVKLLILPVPDCHNCTFSTGPLSI